ncbi:MAG: selenocysteine-specific translation elongation factor [Alphaproteobacteria bacterium]
MIVGTAGHIDHGKSALVRRLTGVDPDRLKEEKERGITIDLGFAYMPAGDGNIIGFVDVPGHDRFVRNMLAGATGIDFVLLVVAADDGIMPQTREHLAIVDLLGITSGLVALTKVDLVSADRRAEVTQDIRKILESTGLSEAKILAVSAVTDEGIEELRGELIAAARAFRARKAQGRFRLAVDRCFTIAGAGTIVTGSVMSGTVSVGDNIAVSPSGLRARVRSIHAQNKPAERGSAGERGALNLVGDGVNKQAIVRGDVALDPILHAPAGRIDAILRLLDSEARPLAHWTPVHLHHAAAEVPARVALLEETPISPGASGRIQLVLERPIAAAAGDRFILRDTSASRTIGGGRFVDLRAPHRHRRAQARLAQLEALAIEEPSTSLAALLDRWPFLVDIGDFARDRALSEEQVQETLRNVAHVKVAAGAETVLFSPAVWQRLSAGASAAVEAFHRANPEARGMNTVQLAAALEPRLPSGISAAVIGELVKSGAFASEGGVVRAIGHRSRLDERDERLRARIAPLLSGGERFRPPRANEIAALLEEQESDVRRVLKILAQQREIVEVAPDHFFLRETVDEMAAIVAEIARAHPNGEISAAQFRDRLNNGRKIAIQILEYFDRQGLTVRRGDLRRVNVRRLEQFAHASGPALIEPN